MPSSLPSGTDVRILLQNCQCDFRLLTEPDQATPHLRDCIDRIGFQALSQTAHSFEGDGYTLAIVLAESHMVVHTWPEYDNLILIDISVCDFLRPNRNRTLQLRDELVRLFQPQQHVDEVSTMVPRLMDNRAHGQGAYHDIHKLLQSRRTEAHSIVLAETPSFGTTLLVNGVVQGSQQLSAYYYEPLVHVPLIAHRHPERVLIVGGGDGFAAREVLKHPGVRECVIHEPDRALVETTRSMMERIRTHALTDDRVQVCHAGLNELLRQQDAPFDCILVDPRDPVSVEKSIPASHDLQALTHALAHDGYLVLVGGTPHTGGDLQALSAAIQPHALNWALYLPQVPTLGNTVQMAIASKTGWQLPDQARIEETIARRELPSLEVISAETYGALFALPPRVKSLLKTTLHQNEPAPLLP